MTGRRLVVNVDHVATVRQARGGVEPDPVAAAVQALAAGADGIVVHLREDRRHIQDRDVRLLRQVVHRLFCLEMAATGEMLEIALQVRPDSVTLVPERREELTTEGGLDVLAGLEEIGGAVRSLEDSGIRSCLFIDPDLDQVEASLRSGARAVELHSGEYARAGSDRGGSRRALEQAAKRAAKLGLEVGVGHGLDYRNVSEIAALPEIEEFSIGHAIVAHSLTVGFGRAVREMRQIVCPH
ncbi:MAG: pyridoxine 5'-phosphate synthase [Proteobacteria bacterium]|nr:pyridoxine 5'-phosphate synthase [Pseudomonadota bacterium]